MGLTLWTGESALSQSPTGSCADNGSSFLAQPPPLGPRLQVLAVVASPKAGLSKFENCLQVGSLGACVAALPFVNNRECCSRVKSMLKMFCKSYHKGRQV